MKKIFAFFAAIALLYACKPSDTTRPNRPPNAFTATPTLKTDGKTIVLNWTKAKDPDGDAVTYTVVLKDTLSKNISDTTYTLSKLDFNYNQAGKIIAKDAKGLTTEASFTATTKVITYVKIPDALFEKYLVDYKIDKDGLVNGQMNADDAKGVKAINVTSSDIESLVGIEAFVDLEELYCGNTWEEIPTGRRRELLDVSKNVNLKILECNENNLTTLDLSKNVNLLSLDCSYNENLNNLDVSKCIALQNLNCRCDNNKTTTLDVSKNVNLQSLQVGWLLKTIDLSKNVALQNLEVQNPSLTTLDISKNVALQTLFCGGFLLTTLDLSKNIALQTLTCWGASLTTLDLSKNINLIRLVCYNPITTLDLSKNVALQYLYCLDTPLTTLDVRKNIALKTLILDNNQLKTLRVGASVEYLSCGYNQLTTLDISKNVGLQELLCYKNQLNALDVSKNTVLQHLNCSDNQIKTICVADIAKAYANPDWVRDPTVTYAICK